MSTVQAVRGMNDILPGEAVVWQHVESVLRETLHRYAYQEIRLPLLEKTELFARSIGEATDIVAKEMYTFEDRNGESLTLRPEGTASCVRASLEKGLFHNQTQRLWYMGPMFRYERPQRGRFRQFHQIGAEAFGWEGPDIDAELIALGHRFWCELEIVNRPQLQINCLGDGASRIRYRDMLVEYLEQYRTSLDADSQRRLDTNPLRILDSKDTNTQRILESAPDILDFLDVQSRQHFDGLRSYLDRLGIRYIVNTKLVRGLDYYSHTVFEWVSEELGAQGAVCAGGRYDELVQQLGGRKKIPGIGFALGLERLVDLVKEDRKGSKFDDPLDVYLVSIGNEARQLSFQYAERLRDIGLSVQTHCGEGGIKNQMKHADRSGARFAVLVADDEVQQSAVTLKLLDRGGAQHMVNESELEEKISEHIKQI